MLKIQQSFETWRGKSRRKEETARLHPLLNPVNARQWVSKGLRGKPCQQSLTRVSWDRFQHTLARTR
eukprot:2028725-Prorocentrum_lima.AAC.1